MTSLVHEECAIFLVLNNNIIIIIIVMMIIIITNISLELIYFYDEFFLAIAFTALRERCRWDLALC